MPKRVVITGIGIWSCIGTDVDSVRQLLYEGRSGIVLRPERLEYGYMSGLTGVVPEPNLTKKDINRHVRAGMSEEAKYDYTASRQAFADAGRDEEYLPPNEIG